MAKHYDYLVIGAGSGGIASANRAAQYGKKCALIEVADLGGTCVNVGCVPKKVMWYSAQIADAIQKYGPDYGFNTELKSHDWNTLIQNRQAYIQRIHASYQSGLAKNNVDVIQGFARFVNEKTVEVNQQQYTADHILIATGTEPTRPDIEGAELGIDSNGFFELQQLPKRTAIVGSGYIAVELAGVLNGLGSEVGLFIRKQLPLRSLDQFLGETLLECMRDEHIQVHTQAIPKKVTRQADQSLLLHLEDGSQHEVDCLIWAVGRKPNTQALNLAAANVQIDEKDISQ